MVLRQPAIARRFLSVVLVSLVWQAYGDVVSFDHVLAHDAPEYEPTANYTRTRMEGFTVMVSGRLIEDDPKTAKIAQRIVRAQLTRFSMVAPVQVRKLRRTTKVWLTVGTTGPSAAHYIPAPAEVLEHIGRNPDFAKSIEIYNVPKFVQRWKHVPATMIHELAHAYHDQLLPNGFQNAQILDAFNAAVGTGKYDWVLRTAEPDYMTQHYARVNELEFFAELSVTMLAASGYYPFVKAEFKRYDYDTYRTIAELWRADGGNPTVIADPVEASWVECDQEGTIKSKTGGGQVTLLLENQTAEDRHVYWLDYAANRHDSVAFPLPAGGARTAHTAQFHPWVVTDSDGLCLSILAPGNVSQTVVVDF